VALEARGAEAARPWIEKANATYPCLIDEHHTVAELYGWVNVPQAVWIDEEGQIVRPTETAGTTEGFRQMDRQTFAMPAEARAEVAAVRRAYADALRDWAANGSASRYVLPPDEVLRRMKPVTDTHALAAATFRMGQHIHELGHEADAQKWFEEAKRLRPESWSFARQAWNLEDLAKSGGKEFWSAVDALGAEYYYEPVQLEPGD
jgi:hypothetical protein